MNINLIRLRGVERELQRLNSNLELLLYHAYNITPESYVARPRTPDEPTVTYTDELEDALREQVEALDRAKKLALDPDPES